MLGGPNELAAIPDDEPAAIWAAIMTRLLSIEAYRERFSLAFPDAGGLKEGKRPARGTAFQ